MPRQRGKDRKRKKDISRREFIRRSAGVGTAAIAGPAALKPAGVTQQGYPQETKRAAHNIGRNAILFAIGDTLIPSEPGDPGYRDLEWYGITDEISRRIEVSDEDLDHFNRSSLELLGKKFSELAESRRADYFNRIVQGSGSKDEQAQKKLRETYNHVREMVFTVYYQNFPQHSWPRDSNRAPLLRRGDRHQITNPNTPDIVTGWDQAGYAGPLTWEEEERRRNHFKKIKWQE